MHVRLALTTVIIHANNQHFQSGRRETTKIKHTHTHSPSFPSASYRCFTDKIQTLPVVKSERRILFILYLFSYSVCVSSSINIVPNKLQTSLLFCEFVLPRKRLSRCLVDIERARENKWIQFKMTRP